MSRIGKQTISVPNGVEVSIQERTFTIKGPKGELSYTHLPEVSVKYENDLLTVSPNDDSKTTRAYWGLTRSLLNNMIIGVTEGYKKELEIIGVGYKAEVQGQKIILSLGFSHKINYDIPEGIKVEHRREKNDILTITGINKEIVGAVAAKIRSYKKPEPYKGKGIRYIDEYVERKEGKTAASTS